MQRIKLMDALVLKISLECQGFPVKFVTSWSMFDTTVLASINLMTMTKFAVEIIFKIS